MKKITTILALLVITSLFSQIPSYVPTNGLVGYWPFNGNANDLSGNGNNGIVNGATLTTDRFGVINNAYNYDGDNDFIIIPNNRIFDSNNISFSMWISSSNLQRQWAIVRTNFSNASNEHFALTFNFILQSEVSLCAKYNVPNCNAGQGWQYNTVNQNIMNNNFHHVVGTIEGNKMKLYIDNLLTQTLTTSFPQTSSCWGGDIQIGRNWSNFTDYFNGKIDDICIWNRALTQEEITNLYLADTDTCQSLVINTGILSFNPVTYNNTVTIYPNPANDQITIDCGTIANVTGYQIKIVNTLGQEVFSGAMNTQKYVLPLNTLGSTGVYFVKIFDAANNLLNTKKIILQ